MKNKKILGALAALCMGIILCVSSVFAVNYWYSIANNGQSNTVTLGNALTIELTDAIDDEKYLYPGGIVTFGEIKVTGVLDWNYANVDSETQTDGIANQALPQFALRVKSVNDAATAAYFTVYSNFQGTDGKFASLGTLEEDMLIIDDLQEKTTDGTITFNLRLALAGDAPATLANKTVSFVLEVVAYLGADYENGELIVDAENEGVVEEDIDGVNNNNKPVIDPTTALN